MRFAGVFGPSIARIRFRVSTTAVFGWSGKPDRAGLTIQLTGSAGLRPEIVRPALAAAAALVDYFREPFLSRPPSGSPVPADPRLGEDLHPPPAPVVIQSREPERHHIGDLAENGRFGQ
jgi:hypothetical protein